MMQIQRIAAVTVLALTLAATGCSNSGGGASKRDDTTGGSASAKKVPQDARRVAEATGGRLIHRPLREGTIYVVDGTNEKVIYSGPVRAGANVVVDPAANAVTVNDQQVKPSVRLETGHTYRLYFMQK
jgi:hypothetical protein